YIVAQNRDAAVELGVGQRAEVGHVCLSPLTRRALTTLPLPLSCSVRRRVSSRSCGAPAVAALQSTGGCPSIGRAGDVPESGCNGTVGIARGRREAMISVR